MNTQLNTLLATILVIGFIGMNSAIAQPAGTSLLAGTGPHAVLSATRGSDSDCSQGTSGRIHRSAGPQEAVEAIRTSVCASA